MQYCGALRYPGKRASKPFLDFGVPQAYNLANWEYCRCLHPAEENKLLLFPRLKKPFTHFAVGGLRFWAMRLFDSA
jgi:hypothetical protein